METEDSTTVLALVAPNRKLGRSGDPTALNQPDHHGYDREHKEDVNESAQRVRSRQTQSPENKKNHSECPQHDRTFLSTGEPCRRHASRRWKSFSARDDHPFARDALMLRGLASSAQVFRVLA